MVDVPFSEFAFAATGTTAERTMPDRLAEVLNVKDFGATGDGSTNDAPAIQAAINARSGANRGTIYFPPCAATYKITSPLTLNYNGPLSIVFRGSGIGSRIAATTTGYAFTRTLGTASNEADVLFDNMYVTNPTGGCFRIGSARKVAFREGNFTGKYVYNAENTDGGLASSNTLFSGCIIAGPGDANVVGSVGIIMAGGVIEGTDLRGFDVGYRIAGSGTTIWGGRTERNNTAFEFGVGNASQARGAATDIGAQGVAIIGHTFEGHWIAMHFAGTTEGFFASGIEIQGHDLTNAGQPQNTDGTQIGIWIPPNKLKGAHFNGFRISNYHEVAGVKLDDPTVRPFITLQNITGDVSAGGGDEWVVSAKAMAARYINCAGAPTVYTFANLPDSSNRLEGDEYDISDSSTATWGATVTGGGSNHVRVRFNGTNWTVVGM